MNKNSRNIFLILFITAVIYAAGLYFKNTALGLFSILVAWLLIWALIKKEKSSWKDFGFNRPKGWPRTWLIAILGVLCIHILVGKLLKPQITKLTGPLNLSEFESIYDNPSALALGLLVVWTLAAFGEEMVFRGYFLNSITGLFKKGRFVWLLGVFISSAIFGLGHIYQGFSGVILAFVVGVLYCLVYFLNHRNLWAPILMHGLYDTFAFLILYFGLEI